MRLLGVTIAILFILNVMPLVCLSAEAINGCHTLMQGYIAGWIINACIAVACLLVGFVVAIIEGDF